MKRKILCFVIAAAMTAAMGTKTSAEEFQGKRSWTVEFDGEAVESNFQSSELTEQIYQIQPGDSIELQVAIGNSGGSETDWYMTNEVLQSLEDSQSVAEGVLCGTGWHGNRNLQQCVGGRRDRCGRRRPAPGNRIAGRLFLSGPSRGWRKRTSAFAGSVGWRNTGQRLPGYAGKASDEFCRGKSGTEYGNGTGGRYGCEPCRP